MCTNGDGFYGKIYMYHTYSHFNPFELNGPSNHFKLDEFISSFRVELYKVFLFKFLWNILAQITGP